MAGEWGTQDIQYLLRGFAEDLAQSLEPMLERAMAKGMYDAYATLQMLTVPDAATVALVTAQAQELHRSSAHSGLVPVRKCPYPVCQAFNTWCQEWDLPEEATGG